MLQRADDRSSLQVCRLSWALLPRISETAPYTAILGAYKSPVQSRCNAYPRKLGRSFITPSLFASLGCLN